MLIKAWTLAILLLPTAALAQTPPASRDGLTLTRQGVEPRVGPASNFTGKVTITGPFKGTGGSKLSGATVTFEPRARSNWHTHPLGQLLVVTKGIGFVQAEGGPVREMRAGDVIWTPPGVKHWHGASETQSVSHVAMSEAVDGQVVTWGEPVTETVYKGGLD